MKSRIQLYAEWSLLGACLLLIAGSIASWGYAANLNRQAKRVIAASEPKEELVEQAEAEDEESEEAETNDGSGRGEQGGRDFGGRRGPRRGGRGGPGGDGPLAALPDDLSGLIKSKKIFGTPNTQLQVQGILDDTALINNQWMRVGDERNGIKLIEIDGQQVVLEVFGERKEIPVWNSPIQDQAPQRAAPQSPGDRSQRGREWGRRGGRGFGRPDFGNMTEEQRREMERMRDEFRRRMQSGEMTPEDFRRMREQGEAMRRRFENN